MKTNLYIKTAYKLHIPSFGDKDFPYNYSVTITSDEIKIDWTGNACYRILFLYDLEYFVKAYVKYLNETIHARHNLTHYLKSTPAGVIEI